jgi:hypothetical protein
MTLQINFGMQVIQTTVESRELKKSPYCCRFFENEMGKIA